MDTKTIQRVSHYALKLRRRSNGEAVVRLVLAAVLVGLVVLLYQKHEPHENSGAHVDSRRVCR